VTARSRFTPERVARLDGRMGLGFSTSRSPKKGPHDPRRLHRRYRRYCRREHRCPRRADLHRSSRGPKARQIWSSVTSGLPDSGKPARAGHRAERRALPRFPAQRSRLRQPRVELERPNGTWSVGGSPHKRGRLKEFAEHWTSQGTNWYLCCGRSPLRWTRARGCSFGSPTSMTRRRACRGSLPRQSPTLNESLRV